MTKTITQVTVVGSRAVGRGKDVFILEIFDSEGRGTTINMTPEQWALALWSRGDVQVEATIKGLVPEKSENSNGS